jgi:hypothetical protein
MLARFHPVPGSSGPRWTGLSWLCMSSPRRSPGPHQICCTQATAVTSAFDAPLSFAGSWRSLLLLEPSVFAAGSFDQHEAMRGFGNGAISVALLGVLLLLGPEPWVAGFLYAVLAQYHSVIVLLQLRNPLPPPAPPWLAPAFHGALGGWLAGQALARLNAAKTEKAE